MAETRTISVLVMNGVPIAAFVVHQEAERSSAAIREHAGPGTSWALVVEVPVSPPWSDKLAAGIRPFNVAVGGLDLHVSPARWPLDGTEIWAPSPLEALVQVQHMPPLVVGP